MTSKQAKAAYGKATGLEMKEKYTKQKAQEQRKAGSGGVLGKSRGTLVDSEDDEDDEDDEMEMEDQDGSDGDMDAEDDDEPSHLTTKSKARRTATPKAAASAANIDLDQTEELPPPIPAKLLTRLLYEGFADKEVKIGKEAMAVVSKYVETFVRETLARASLERGADGDTGAVGDGFLQVEDLEKLAPQLLLDF